MKYFSFIKEFEKHLSDKELRDLARTLFNLENSIIYRRGHYIKLDIRIIHDITKHILKKYMLELPTKTQESWGIKEYLYSQQRKFSIKGLAENLDDSVWTSECDKENLLKLYNEGNNEVHYDPNKFNEVRGKSRESNYNADDMYSIAMAILYIYKWIGTVIFDIDLSFVDADTAIFNDGSKSFHVMENREEFESLIGIPCPLCEKGTIISPENKTFTYGPYLQCNDKECGANVSKGMNFRRKTNISCETQGCVGKEGKPSKYKDTFTYKNKQRFNACIVCGKTELSKDEMEFNFWDSLE